MIMIGKAGSGKGTQARKIAEEYGLKHISMGDVLREEVKKGGELGQKIKEYQTEGKLVPLDITLEALKENIDENNLFDGFPRNLEQAEALDALVPIDLVINLQIPDETAIERLSKRRQCKKCGAITDDTKEKCPECEGELYQREDDKPEAIKKRLELYHDVTEPLMEYYKPRELVSTVDGTQTPEEIFQEIKQTINEQIAGGQEQ